MTQHHSAETHASLMARLPEVTGRSIDQWHQVIEDAPAFSRSDEMVHWIEDEHDLSHGYATAIVHEYDLVRAARRVG